jgi:hypothetical protein
MFSIGFVVARLRAKAAGSLKPMTVSVSSRPSRSDAAADGCSVSRARARFRSRFLAVATVVDRYAWDIEAPIDFRFDSGRWSTTLRRL